MRFVLLFQKLSTRLSFCSSSGNVSPCATTEKTTTSNGAIRISSWSVKDVVEAPHQEGAVVHPLLDGAEGALDGLTAPGEDVPPGLQSVVER
jgi:hypothetical protein